MTTNQTATLLPQILDHPRVRELMPGWYSQLLRCSGCHETPYKCKCPIETAPPYERHGDYFYTGPLLLHPANLNDVLELGDALADDYLESNKCDVFWSLHHKCYYATIEQGTESPGPTRSDAVVAAIARALNIKEGNDND